jgi:hypothetical protein
MAANKAALNRKIRQDALREQLSKQKHVEKVVDNIKKMEQQGAVMETNELSALKYATDTRLKLINKYLPDVKSVEHTGEGGSDLVIKVTNYGAIDGSSDS